MHHRAIATLQEILRPHVGLGKSRLETLCLLVVGMISARTVNLSHLACERPTTAQVASTYRRLQRFFQHVRLGPDWSAPLVIGLLGLVGPWRLALDRTQWKLGTRDVNILMLAVVTRRARAPLMWSVLDNDGGSSDTAARVRLMQRYLAIFGAASIRLLLADREFVGVEWMNFLNENNISFAIRMKEKLVVTTEDGRRLALGPLPRKCRGVRTFRAALVGDDAPGPLWLNFAARRLQGGELLIVVSNTPARAALAACRERIRHCRPDQWRDNGSSSNVSSATPRPEASTSRTPGSSPRASSPCSLASSPSPWPGRPGPPRCWSDARPPPERRMDTSPSPGSASASIRSEGSCATTRQPQ